MEVFYLLDEVVAEEEAAALIELAEVPDFGDVLVGEVYLEYLGGVVLAGCLYYEVFIHVQNIIST